MRFFADSKNTPGERWSCETTTRSVPLMMNVPWSVIKGISPKKTSCSLMSRTDLRPPVPSFSKTVSLILTFSGAEKVIPRCWHSSTSYFSLRLTGSPHFWQKVTLLAVIRPHLPQSSLAGPLGSLWIGALQCWHLVRRWNSPLSDAHLHSQSPIVYSTKSSELISRKSEIGNTDLNTASSPVSSRSLGSRSICRKRA